MNKVRFSSKMSILKHLTFFYITEDVNVLPGAPVPIETLEMRLSGETKDTDLFGPELPPVMKGWDISSIYMYTCM